MGRVSGRYLETFIESNEATKRKRGDNLRLKDLTRRKELGLPIDDDEAQALSARGRRGAALTQATSRVQPSQADGSKQAAIHEKNGEDDEEEDEYAGLAVTSRAPKVRYDANGNLVLDETELQFDRQAEADEELAARGPMEVIIETDRGKFTNHASYSKKPRVERWSKDETEMFYTVRDPLDRRFWAKMILQGLRMFHTGFELIARTLPNRNRTMVRNKFKAEDRRNPEKITHYLSSGMRLPYGTLSTTVMGVR
jgi:transcription factor TFIIIB component B''